MCYLQSFVNQKLYAIIIVLQSICTTTLKFGDCDIDGAITVTSGTVDVDGVFDATGGFVTFTGDGELIVDSTVTSLGTLSTANGTVTYNGATAQTIVAGAYPSLKASDAAGIKTLGGTVTVAGGLIIDASVTVDMNGNTLGVTGTTDIDGVLDVADNILTLGGASNLDGTMTISTGTVDANGTFDATGGFVTFTDAGNLNLFFKTDLCYYCNITFFQ